MYLHFNSIKVQLRQVILFQIYVQNADFNSIKVQLRLQQSLPSAFGTTLFQFHKGTIKTEVERAKAEFENISIP